MFFQQEIFHFSTVHERMNFIYIKKYIIYFQHKRQGNLIEFPFKVLSEKLKKKKKIFNGKLFSTLNEFGKANKKLCLRICRT